ncbi:MAG TPA: endonuclease III [Alphaproteobacteria bacterium]
MAKTKNIPETVETASKPLKPAVIVEMFERFKQHNPEPTTELNYTNAFTLLVAVVCSAQMTDKGVNRATEELFKIADTPQKMLTLGAEKVGDYLKTINFHGTKTKNVMALSQILVDDYGGKVPDDHAELIKLPGVGNKTANVILNTMFGRNTMAVDTHIFRVANRTGLTKGTTPEQVEAGLLKRIPEEYLYHAHHWLILHGRYVCKARKPDCPTCIVRDLCNYPHKTEIKIAGQKSGAAKPLLTERKKKK